MTHSPFPGPVVLNQHAIKAGQEYHTAISAAKLNCSTSLNFSGSMLELKWEELQQKQNA